MKHTCYRCGYSTNDKSNYNKHLKGNTKCTEKLNNTLNNTFECKYCNKSFSTNSNMNRHIRLYCKEAKLQSQDSKLRKEIVRLQEENRILKKQNKSLLSLVKGGSYNPYTTHKKVNRLLRKENASTNTQYLPCVGCTLAYLFDYIQSQLKEGMVWENRGCWHLDHRKPVQAFDLSDEMERKKCCHYTNYQPLWANDNLTKSCKHNENDFDYKWEEKGWVKIDRALSCPSSLHHPY